MSIILLICAPKFLIQISGYFLCNIYKIDNKLVTNGLYLEFDF